jgi:hypothetical protein
VLLAVKVEAVATPLLVVAVVVAVPLAKVPLAPVDGAVKVTVTFDTRFPEASLTVTCSGVANGAVPADDCALPAVAVREVGEPTPLFPLLVLPPPVQPKRKMLASTNKRAIPFGNDLGVGKRYVRVIVLQDTLTLKSGNQSLAN